jgi:chromosomal replication initiation ATPase DnaA
MISKTDRLVLGYILHEVRKEFCLNFSIYPAGNGHRSKFESARPRQIFFYLCKEYLINTNRKSLAKFTKNNRTLIIYSENNIESFLTNRTMAYALKRISLNVEKRIKNGIGKLTN